MTDFNPNAAAPEDSGIFGLLADEAHSQVVYLPVAWEVTTSYGGGTSHAPRAILRASKQVDLYDADVLKPYEAGLFMLPEFSEIHSWNQKGKALAHKIIEGLDHPSPDHPEILNRVNDLGTQLNEKIRTETRRLLRAGKWVGVIGGDHSVPFGALQAIAEKYESFGILHFDAHSDTRNAYEGFIWSHASIMRNVLDQIPQVKKIVQVGIRDFCEEEFDFIQSQGMRVNTFFDKDLAKKKFEGSTWRETAQEIIACLPEQVWVSFDIDGLDPRFCPNTGTPVPGGLDFQEANYLLATLVKSGKKIIGFDLNEVAPSPDSSDDWDANVGARLLYKLTGWLLASQGKAKIR